MNSISSSTNVIENAQTVTPTRFETYWRGKACNHIWRDESDAKQRPSVDTIFKVLLDLAPPQADHSISDPWLYAGNRMQQILLSFGTVVVLVRNKVSS